MSNHGIESDGCYAAAPHAKSLGLKEGGAVLRLKQKMREVFGLDPVYVRLRSNSILLRDTSTGKEIEDAPILAISEREPRRVLAVGRRAEQVASQSREPFELCNGFAHPRLLISDFHYAEKALEHLVSQLFSGSLLRASPVVVMHPLERLEGGLTQVEVRALEELAHSAGARQAYVWVGRELQDHELRNEAFKHLNGLQKYRRNWKEKTKKT